MAASWRTGHQREMTVDPQAQARATATPLVQARVTAAPQRVSRA